MRETDTSQRTGGDSHVPNHTVFGNLRLRTMGWKITFLIGTAFLLRLTAWSHQTSDSYLAFSATNAVVEGRWAIALRDLDHVLTIDADKDGEVTEDELKASREAIERYATSRLQVAVDGTDVKIQLNRFELEEHTDAYYVNLVFRLNMERFGSDFLVTYTLFNDTDPLHRGLFRFDLPARTMTTIFSPREPTQRFVIGMPQKSAEFWRFLREGVWHIWIGFDHILFL